ncbi:uncharacterized protein BO80DRAFT_377027 [Aspergillus ibericus CBS 121593]|uniref:ER transporter 6TM N-terminal domain-containing protein n=1 Tax=Aspergillus ibericus CBS 121593 TaxID=1448316 RepID=A0A395H6C6_9EURO|nr:hypothetical protein BO80DRAFT_377027 [Aspergillus ibericus CBS 121593]RAL03166.1 hypothetical protein BO80DRAFT_377027 [Aspergillus ibericus CBS 121593]
MTNRRGSSIDLPGGDASERPRIALPAWLNHFNLRDLKVLFRCWTATWVATILIFIGPALQQIGIATFFGALVLYIAPPAGILFLYLLAALSLLAGMCLGWAWGLLTMKAALAARPAPQTQARLRQLQQEVVTEVQRSGQSSATVTQQLIHDGFMLDARVTVVFYVMICVFIYAVSRLRATNNKFALAQIFSIIISDLFLLFGPSLPSFTALLPRVLVAPGAIGVGLGTICCLLFFPQSTSYAVFSKMEEVLRFGQISLKYTESLLNYKDLNLEQLLETRGKSIGAAKALEPLLAFLPLNFSRGRWNAADVERLQEPLRKTLMAELSLLDYHIARIHGDQNMQRLSPTRAPTADTNLAEKRDRAIGRHQLQQSAQLMDAFQSAEETAIRARTLDALRQSTIPILQACSAAIDTIVDTISTLNSQRWVCEPSFIQIYDQLVRAQVSGQTLWRIRFSSLTPTTEALINNHAEMFDDYGECKSGDGRGAHALRGMIIGMVIEERILAVADATQTLIDDIAWLLSHRSETRIWIPSRLQYALTWFWSSNTPTPMSYAENNTVVDPEVLEEQTREAGRRLRISRGYGTPQRCRTTRTLMSIYKWLFNPAGMYALRMVVVTIATSIPSALPHTAGFYYREKGIWGVITAQTTLLVYTADFTVSLVSRAVGTVVGGVLGMVAWYIGSGHGPGNPYGLGAITAAMTVVLMWWRIFLPPALALAAIMSGATFVLVIGFSYDDANAQQYGLPGRGDTAFWKRLVTVLLGFFAATVVQLFPRPPSATRHVCQTLSNAVRTLSDHYALILSHWARADPDHPVGTVAERITLEMAETLLSLEAPIGLLRWEMSFGPFHRKTLDRTRTLLGDMNQALGRLLTLSATLPLEFQERLIRTVGLTDDYTVGDVMAILGVIEQALMGGAALPERLPTPLVKRCYETWKQQHQTVNLSRITVRNKSYREYCVAITSYLKFLSTIDELVLVLKAALGESHIVDRGETVV